MWENPKTISRNCQDFQISSTLEETFLDGCLKSMGTCHHVQNQSRRKRRRITHGFLRKCQPPACQGSPVATTDRSGWTQCQACKTGNIEQTTRGQDNKNRKTRIGATLQREPKSVAQQREGPGGTPPGNFRHFANSCNEGHSYLMARTTCNCLHHREGTPRGKNSKGLDCLVQELARKWWQWCHMST